MRPRYPASLTLAAFAALATGCSYASQYRAPADGRARVVWRDDRPIAVLPGGNPACESAALQAIQAPPPGAAPRSGVAVTPAADVHFIYVGGVHGHHRHHHHVASPPARGPRFHAASAAGGGAASRGHDAVVAAGHDAVAAGHAATAAGGAPGSAAHGAAAASGAAGSASAPVKRGGSPPKVNPSDGPPELWVVAAVAATVVLPFITLGIVANDPIPHADAAAAVDLANAYNDLARTPGSACAPLPPPEPAPTAASEPAPAPDALQPAPAAEVAP